MTTQTTKENGMTNWISEMVMEHSIGPMAISMKASGGPIKDMDVVALSIVTETFIVVTGSTTLSVATVQ